MNDSIIGKKIDNSILNLSKNDILGISKKNLSKMINLILGKY